MDKFFGNLHLVLVVGFIAALALIGYTGGFADHSQMLRWLHLFFGIVWIGLLYYFNFVQVPTMPAIPAELKPGVTKYIAPKALFFFRWGAVLTLLTGWLIAGTSANAPEGSSAGYLIAAYTLDPSYRLIGIGMWLATIMAFNVWVFIWPAQQKVLGLVEADADAKAKAAKVALIASRTNTLLSIPMLYAMIAANLG